MNTSNQKVIPPDADNIMQNHHGEDFALDKVKIKIFSTKEAAFCLWTVESRGSECGAVIEKHPGWKPLLEKHPAPLVARLLDEVGASEPVVLTLNVIFDDDTHGIVTFTCCRPESVFNQITNFDLNAAVEGVPSHVGRRIKSIIDVTSLTNARRNHKFEIWKLPSETWNELRDVTVKIQPGRQESVTIPDGLHGTNEVVRGLSSAARVVVQSRTGYALTVNGYACLRVEHWAESSMIKYEVMVLKNKASDYLEAQLSFIA